MPSGRERVPSESNVPDAIHRGEFNFASELGARRVILFFDDVWSGLGDAVRARRPSGFLVLLQACADRKLFTSGDDL